jgi:hypothetical protein
MSMPQSRRQTHWIAGEPGTTDRSALPRIGVISNLRSHRHGGVLRQSIDPPQAVTIRHTPDNRAALERAMQDFVRENVDLIVIDGGDGTVREVMSAAHRAYRGNPPRLAVLPAGKTNALAMDLGIPDQWSLADILAAHRAERVAWRSPIHIRWAHGRYHDQLGFIFGFGAYVRATMLAQRVHRRGWFNGFAVFLTLVWTLLRTVLGGMRSPWTRGDTIRISRDDVDIVRENIYLIFGSTLRRMPLGLRPFGRPRDGLKFLAIKAPPRHLLRSLPRLLWSDRSSRLESDGFVRRDVDQITLSIRKSFILDGERFPGGNLTIARGVPIAFLVP